jgi:hypothetical protein
MASVSERQIIEEWRQYRETLMRSTTVETETFSEKQKRIKRLEADDEAWFAYYFPHIAINQETGETIPPADFQRRATKRVMQPRNWIECRCWARSLAKSTRTREEVLKLVLTGKKRNVLMVSNSEENAIRLLAPYMIELETNRRIINDYGKQRGAKWKGKEFITRKGAAFRAVGVGQSPRGSNNNSVRPDCILIDDIDTDEDCENPEIITKRVKWIFNALLGTREIYTKLLVIACGNIISEYCCMTELHKAASYVDVINIRDKNGKSSWPEKNSEEAIDEALRPMPYSTVQQEYYNNPETGGRIFKSLRYEKVPPLKQMEQILVYGDPSTTNNVTKTSSYKPVVMLGRKGNVTYVLKVFCEQCTQARFIQAYYDMYAIVTAAGCTAQYYMECNSLQEGYFDTYYAPEVQRISNERHIPLFINKDAREKASKYTRIEATLEPANRLGWLIFNEREEQDEGMKTTAGQFKAASPTYKGPLDAPDCVEGGYKLLDENRGRSLTEYRCPKKLSRRY